MKFLNTVDLDQNQIVNIVLDSRTSNPPSPINGQLYYNTVSKAVFYWDGVMWVNFSGGVNSVGNGGGVITGGTATNPTVAINVDNTTIEISGNIVRLKDLGVSTAKLADGAVTTIKITDKNIVFSKIQDVPTMTVIGRTDVGSGVTSSVVILNDDSMSTASNTTLATSSSIKAYVDATVANIGTLQGSVNASTATTFPVAASGTSSGDYWYVSVAGTIQGVVLNVGDVMIANINNASTTNPNDWTFLETNRDQATTTLLGLVTLATNIEVQTGTDAVKVVTPASLSSRTATEIRTGLAAIATQVETDAGTDDTKFVTPLKLKAFFNATVGGFATNIGNAAATSFIVSHGLNTTDVVTQLFEVSTGNKVIADISHTSTTTVTVSFTVAPTLNQYRIVIKK